MKKVKIHYISLPDDWRKEDKLQWFSENKMENIPFEILKPDKNANWINLAEENDWESLMPLTSKDVKNKKQKEGAIFQLFTNGVPTNRDEWVYDFDKVNLSNKMAYFCEKYNENINKSTYDTRIKWSRDLKNELKRKHEANFSKDYIIKAAHRPFVPVYQYSEQLVNDVLTQNHYATFGKELNLDNKIICFQGIGIDRPYHILGVKYLPHLQITPNGQYVPLYRYDKEGNRTENITDWALQQFQAHYTQEGRKPSEGFRPSNTVNITKEDIFHYVYAVLHNPKYRQKYEINLKRDFPRIPFYTDFEKWVAWGKTLMDLHINYENAAPFPLIEKSIEKEKPKSKLKAIKENGEIVIDESTSLMGVPLEAYNYKLGNRSAIEWVLDQYKESKPTDPTIAAKFNIYKFADYKTQVIDLLKRVCTVSMETVRIVEEMGKW